MLANSPERFLTFLCIIKKINVSFFNYLLTRNLSDTSINMNMIYGNLITLNPLKKQDLKINNYRKNYNINNASSFFKSNGRN